MSFRTTIQELHDNNRILANIRTSVLKLSEGGIEMERTNQVVDHQADDSESMNGLRKVLDSSVLIDGRILELAQLPLFDGPFIIPHFVLQELEGIRREPTRSHRGRQGLDTIEKLRVSTTVQVCNLDFTNIVSVDDRLIALARELSATLITNDARLECVAQTCGVSTLNLHRLAFTLRPRFLPGERLQVSITRQGRHAGQGVGYLEDGTPMIVDGGGRHIGQAIEVTIQRLLIKPTGAIYFAHQPLLGMESTLCS